jgi:hypothetical protein
MGRSDALDLDDVGDIADEAGWVERSSNPSRLRPQKQAGDIAAAGVRQSEPTEDGAFALV